MLYNSTVPKFAFRRKLVAAIEDLPVLSGEGSKGSTTCMFLLFSVLIFFLRHAPIVCYSCVWLFDFPRNSCMLMVWWTCFD